MDGGMYQRYQRLLFRRKANGPSLEIQILHIFSYGVRVRITLYLFNEKADELSMIIWSFKGDLTARDFLTPFVLQGINPLSCKLSFHIWKLSHKGNIASIFTVILL